MDGRKKINIMTECKVIEKKDNGVDIIEISNPEVKVVVTNLGGHILSIFTKDRNGEFADIVLGCERIEDCLTDGAYMGAMVGRVANRIGNGRFTLNGKEYVLAKNNGKNHLHGGVDGFHKKVYSYEFVPGGVKFFGFSPDGEEGYPGNLDYSFTYKLTGGEFSIVYEAETDQDTIVNFTNHSYFNLSGGSEKIDHHKLRVNAEKISCVDDSCLAAGKFMDVKGTPFDFKEFHEIGERIDESHPQLKFGCGYDHSFLLNHVENQIELVHEASGRKLTISTMMPAVQVYTGNFLADGAVGKNGKPYENRAGVALETQFMPNSINIEEDPKVILRKGEHFYSSTIYRFECESLF